MAKTTEPPKEETAPSTGDRFFAWMRSLDVRREPGWIGGVSAGVAVRLGIDPLIVRGILVVVAILGGPALLVYAAAWLLLPDSNDKIHLEQLIAGKYESAIAGIGVMVLLSLLPLSQGFWFAGAGFWGEPNWAAGFGRALWTLAILGSAVWLVVWLARRGNTPATTRTPPTAPTAGAPAEDFAAWRTQQAAWKAENDAFRREEAAAKADAWRLHHNESMQESARRRAERAAEYRRGNPHPLFSLVVIGLGLIAGGLTWLTIGGGELEFAAVIAGAAVLLAVLALGVIANGVRGKRSGGAGSLAGFVVTPLIVIILIAQFTNAQWGGGGHFTPTDGGSRLPDVYFVGAGDTELDLADYYDRSGNEGNGTDRVYVLAGSSDIEVLLPEGHSVLVDAHIGAGEVYLVNNDGDREPFGDNEYLRDTDGKPELEVRIYVGEGSVTIIEASNEETR